MLNKWMYDNNLHPSKIDYESVDCDQISLFQFSLIHM